MTKLPEKYSKISSSGLIESYQFIPGDRRNESRQYEILPDGYFDLAFLLSESACRIFLAGPYTQKTYVPLGTYELFIVHFRAGRMPTLINGRPRELVNTMIELPGLCGRDADMIGEELIRNKAAGPRQAFIEKLLCHTDALPLSNDRIYEDAVALIEDRGGQIHIRELAHLLNVNTRMLERRFKAILGFSPKMFARLVRFQNIVEVLRSALPACRLTDIAHEFGYTDQSHFIRDFKAMSGALPGSF